MGAKFVLYCYADSADWESVKAVCLRALADFACFANLYAKVPGVCLQSLQSLQRKYEGKSSPEGLQSLLSQQRHKKTSVHQKGLHEQQRVHQKGL